MIQPLDFGVKSPAHYDYLASKYPWINWRKVLPFLDTVDEVLNGHTLLAIVQFPAVNRSETFIENIQAALFNPDFDQVFRQAYCDKESGALWDEEDPYQPPLERESIEVTALDLLVVRDRLEAMLTCQHRFHSPYRKQLEQADAAVLVEGFIQSFSPVPSYWAEVNPELLASLNYLDHFNDGILAIAVDNHIAFLLNNGTD